MSDKLPCPTAKEELAVLVVDNQGLVHDVISSTLYEMGVKNVSSAFNSFHAKRLCSQRHFDIMLISFNVSQDKDGFYLLEELKHLKYINDTTTVVFLSAETSPELVNCIFELQPDDFWVKPLKQSMVEKRLAYLIQIRYKLHKMLYCMEHRDFSTAIYYAERQLKDPALCEYYPRIRRLIGDCLLNLREYASAEEYFRGLLDNMDYGWIHIGLTRALLRQDEIEQAQLLIDELLQRKDTRFQAYDLLARYFIEKKQYELAYEQMKEAGRLAPRNIERNRRLWDLARLNRDKEGQLIAVQNIARHAKNSIHDSLQLTFNVIRATIDIATSLGDVESEKYCKRAESAVEDLKSKKGILEFSEQLDVISARLLCLKGNKRNAESIMKGSDISADKCSLEDNLDKMKAFHELGMKEHCLQMLETLRRQIEGDTLTSQVVNEYLTQEAIERSEIQFTTKELKQMAMINYKQDRLMPAYNNLTQAFTLSPKDKQVALSLLKLTAQIHGSSGLSNEQLVMSKKAAELLSRTELTPTQNQKREQYMKRIGFEIEATGSPNRLGKPAVDDVNELSTLH